MSKEIDSHTFEWIGLTRARCVYNNVFRVLSVEMSVVAHRKRKKNEKEIVRRYQRCQTNDNNYYDIFLTKNRCGIAIRTLSYATLPGGIRINAIYLFVHRTVEFGSNAVARVVCREDSRGVRAKGEMIY